MSSQIIDGADSNAIACAYAVAGWLEATNGPRWAEDFDPEITVRALVDARSSQRGILWMLPNLDRASERGVTRDDLLRIWNAAAGHIDVSEAARLVLVPHAGAWGPSELATLPEAIGRLRAQMWSSEWNPASPELVGSIALGSFKGSRPQTWNWPLRIDVTQTDLRSRASSNEAVQRGLAVVQREQFGRANLTLSRTSPRHRAKARRRSGLFVTISTGGVHEPEPATLIRASTTDLDPSAVVSLPSDDQLDAFLSALIYELAHNLPADLALTSAWHQVGRDGFPPILIGPTSGYFERMDEARLERRVTELANALTSGWLSDEHIPLPLNLDAFELDPSVPRTFGELGRDIARRLKEGRVRFDRESDAGERILELRRILDLLPPTLADEHSPEVRLEEVRGFKEFTVQLRDISVDIKGIRSRIDTESELDFETSGTERFLDVGLLHGHFFAGDMTSANDRLQSSQPLQANSAYTLEIAVRAILEGLFQDTEEPVVPPRKGRESVRVYADVKIVGRGTPNLEDELLPLEWPFDTDAGPAYFRLQTGAEAPSRDCVFEIRLLSADLQPIDHVEIRFDDQPEVSRWTIVRAAERPPPLAPPNETAKNALLLKVSRTGDFTINATLKREGMEPLVVPFTRSFLDGDIEALLTDLRDFWTELVVGKMATRDALSSGGFSVALEKLQSLGARAWRELFGDRYGGGAGASEALGQMLREKPLPQGSAIRISLARNAESFVFPWALLWDPQRENSSFWGLEYEIEIARPTGQPRKPVRSLARISTTVDPGFGDIVDHAATLQNVVGSRARLKSATTTDAIFETLGDASPADLYYFFCHGISAQSVKGLDQSALKALQACVDSIEDDAARRPWTLFLDRLAHARGGARMFTGASEITEQDLRNVEFFKTRDKPLIFLNMCHSADLMPGMSSGLARIFLDRDAGAVIGTECPVTAQFADAFAREMLDHLLDGKRLGETLLETRRSFHENRNPLALLYTVYGSANFRLTKPRIKIVP